MKINFSIDETKKTEMDSQLRGVSIVWNEADSMKVSKLDGGFVNYVKFMIHQYKDDSVVVGKHSLLFEYYYG